VIGLLELLKDDPELYVRRSVANNLNDIGKDHPEVLVEVCRRWLEGASGDRKWIVRHALRSLVKKGHPGALALMGAGGTARVRIESVRFSAKRVRVGEKLSFRFALVSAAKKPQSLLVDYAVHFVKANGKTGRKVFKLKRLELGAGERVELGGSVSFREMTTRKLYPGLHRVEVLVNGKAMELGAVKLSGA
jgi:hypothetical protein